MLLHPLDRVARMDLLTLGINHNTADIEVREKVAFTPQRLAEALPQAHRTAALREVAILSTCNRTELYCAVRDRDPEPVLRWLCDFHRLPPSLIAPALYTHWDEQAVRHVMRVASGLDSMVLGEPQILGQVKAAFALARAQGTLGPQLHRMAETTYSVAKRVRTDTSIGDNPVSVAYAAVSLAKQIFSHMPSCHALLIGAGETIELVARHLKSADINQLTIANRTVERARRLADNLGGEAISLADLARHLPAADIVIGSTGSQLPILGKGAVESALRERRQKPMFLVDLAVPRDIEPEVANLANAYLYSIDDLQQIVAENVAQRTAAAREAEHMVATSADAFARDSRAMAAKETVVALRNQFGTLRDHELERALQSLTHGEDAEQVLRKFAHQLTNKLLHAPTLAAKRAGADDDHATVDALHRLFDLNKPPV